MKGFIFPVQSDVLAEIEKRSSRLLAENASQLGYGSVPASILKVDSRTVMRTFASCLSEIRPIKNEKEEKTIIENDSKSNINSIFDNFFSDFEKKESKAITNPKRKFNIKDDILSRARVKSKIEAKIEFYNKTKIPPAVKICIDPRIKTYYDKCKEMLEMGMVGQLPKGFKKTTEFPKTLENLIKSSHGQLLKHFCNINKK